MVRINQKDLRILKLHQKGLKIPVIAHKCGYVGKNDQEGIVRVKEALVRMGIK